MSDNRRRYRTIRDALESLYPREPQGNLARHLHTLAALISGIVGSRRTNLPDVAGKVPDGTKLESRVKKYARWVANADVDFGTFFLPFAAALIASLVLVQPTLTLVMDGSVVGRGCVALMVSVLYQGRALPLAWVVVKGRKGHFPEDAHVALLGQVHSLIPSGTPVVFLGDGEFDGTILLGTVQGYGWQYVCRTAKNTILSDAGKEFAFEEVNVERGCRISLPEVDFTRQGYGPVHAIAWWDRDYEEPLYLVTNVEQAEEACDWYRKRFRIETFFSDQKSRGFHLHKSHLSDPKRLFRLMIAACLAYIWIVHVGVLAIRDGWNEVIHRTDRCDLSLFQLGRIYYLGDLLIKPQITRISLIFCSYIRVDL